MNAMTVSDIRALARNVRITWAVPAVWRCDAPKALVNGRLQSWAERLNRAVFAARSWAGMETIERRHARMLADRAVRASVFEANLER
jgi:hypothetical protein